MANKNIGLSKNHVYWILECFSYLCLNMGVSDVLRVNFNNRLKSQSEKYTQTFFFNLYLLLPFSHVHTVTWGRVD